MGSVLVVMENGRVLGIIAGRDLSHTNADWTVADVMTHVVTIEPDATMRRAAGVMRGRAVGCLLVVQEGSVAGIVTTSDLLDAIAKGESRIAAEVPA